MPLFRETLRNNAADITRLANAVLMKHYHDGDAIMTQGTRGDSLVVVIEGEVNLVVGGNFIKKLVVEKDPICFGESVFFMEDSKRTASIVAASEKCVSLELTISALHSLFDETHALWAKLRTIHEETVARDRLRKKEQLAAAEGSNGGGELPAKENDAAGGAVKDRLAEEHGLSGVEWNDRLAEEAAAKKLSNDKKRKGYVNLLEFLDLVQASTPRR